MKDPEIAVPDKNEVIQVLESVFADWDMTEIQLAIEADGFLNLIVSLNVQLSTPHTSPSKRKRARDERKKATARLKRAFLEEEEYLVERIPDLSTPDTTERQLVNARMRRAKETGKETTPYRALIDTLFNRIEVLNQTLENIDYETHFEAIKNNSVPKPETYSQTQWKNRLFLYCTHRVDMIVVSSSHNEIPTRGLTILRNRLFEQIAFSIGKECTLDDLRNLKRKYKTPF